MLWKKWGTPHKELDVNFDAKITWSKGAIVVKPPKGGVIVIKPPEVDDDRWR